MGGREYKPYERLEISPVFPTDIDIAEQKQGNGCLQGLIELNSI
jgi:hypothetical protein